MKNLTSVCVELEILALCWCRDIFTMEYMIILSNNYVFKTKQGSNFTNKTNKKEMFLNNNGKLIVWKWPSFFSKYAFRSFKNKDNCSDWTVQNLIGSKKFNWFKGDKCSLTNCQATGELITIIVTKDIV